ncbi:hypothetical protein BKA70DRAFT_1562486 [Coprinopsis sp. MPI-PUGE-AT-0042]|nr:hypothetical protein BKA70DRAFT_1562486 [Coprinopsis sp. MPI-PUGE-AT-0042]
MAGPPFRRRRSRTLTNESEATDLNPPSNDLSPQQHAALIQGILASDPSQCPTLYEIVDAQFFTHRPVPAFIPTSAHDAPPDFRHIIRSASDTNLPRLRSGVLLDAQFGSHLQAQEDASVARIVARNLGGATGQPHASAPPGRHTGRDIPLPPPPAPSRNIATSVAQQGKESQRTVQPGSPISALLSLARQPLLVGPTATGAGAGLQVEGPLGRRSVTRVANGVIAEGDKDAAGEMGTRRPSGSRQSTLGRAAGTATVANGNGFTTAQKMMSRLEEEEAREARRASG